MVAFEGRIFDTCYDSDAENSELSPNATTVQAAMFNIPSLSEGSTA